MNIASKKVTAPAYKHVKVLSIEIKTTCITDRRKLRVTIISLSEKRNLEAWKCYFQRSPRAVSDLRILRIIYFVHCLSKPLHIESVTLATSVTKQKTVYLETSKCFTFQSHHSKFVVIKLSELP